MKEVTDFSRTPELAWLLVVSRAKNLCAQRFGTVPNSAPVWALRLAYRQH